MSRRQPDATVETILNDLYASEINCDIRSFWDGGVDVAMGDYMNGYIASKTGLKSWREIARWLTKMAICYYLQSEFADKYRPSGPKRGAEQARQAVGSAAGPSAIWQTKRAAAKARGPASRRATKS